MSVDLCERVPGAAQISQCLCSLLRLCGEYRDGTLFRIGNSNKMTVEFKSDTSYVDMGFSAEFEAVKDATRK